MLVVSEFIANDLGLVRADDSCHRRRQQLMVAVPWVGRIEMAFDPVFGPFIEFELDRRPHRRRLQPQRGSREVRELRCAKHREMKPASGIPLTDPHRPEPWQIPGSVCSPILSPGVCLCFAGYLSVNDREHPASFIHHPIVIACSGPVERGAGR